MGKKLRTLGCILIMGSSFFPANLIFAETVQDVPVGETTISSKAEDPLKEYKEKSQNQVPTPESTDVLDVPEVESEPDASSEVGLEAAPIPFSDSSGEPPEIKNERIEPRGGIMPMAGNVLEEGSPSSLTPYDIDKNFANAIRSIYPAAPNPMTDDFMESLSSLSVSSKSLTSIKGIEFAVNLTKLDCRNNQLSALDVSNNTALTYLDCQSNQLNNLITNGAVALTNLECSYNQLSDLDLSSNTALTELNCYSNQLINLDVSNSTALITLECSGNQLNTLDVSSNLDLSVLKCGNNNLSALDVSNNTALTHLECPYNQLSSLVVSNKPALTYLRCSSNQLNSLDASNNPILTRLECVSNQLSNLNVSNSIALDYLHCTDNQLSDLDLSSNTALTELNCAYNPLGDLDVSNNIALTTLLCRDNQLSDLDVSNNTALTFLNCYSNQLSSLDVSNNIALTRLECSFNQLSDLDVSNNTALTFLGCSNNQLSDLNVSNTALTRLDGLFNRLSNITSLNGLTDLTGFSVSNQEILIPVPDVSNDGKTVIDVLKTTTQAGLSAQAWPTPIVPTPSFAYNGDKILLSNVSRASLSDKSISFSYNPADLSEGAPSGSGYKEFNGTITFFSVSDLDSELKPINKDKVYKDKEAEWKWTVTSLTTKKAENIQAKLNLPAGLSIVPGSIVVQKNGSPGPAISDLEITNNLGDLVNQGDDITISFKTTASGNVDEWLEATGDLDWKDDTITSPYSNQSKGAVQILDDEQVYKPEVSKDLALESFPKAFIYGVQEMKSAATTYNLDTDYYQTHTNVTTKGFHTRIKDDRSVSTGWKLTVGLSNFEDKQGQVMPNSAGTELVLGNLSIENILDRDTPQETINPTPTGTPSTVQTSETLVAGQTPKILISAQPGEGQEIWQLRMPFNDVSLNVPANAGKKSTLYKAKLTWSLDNTP